MLNYPAYYWIRRAFQSTTATMTELATNIRELKSNCADTSLLGNFLENHDNPRFASFTTEAALTRNAIAFTTFSDGITIMYYGQEQGFTGAQDPDNREPLWTTGYARPALYTYIARLNAARAIAVAKDTTYVTSQSVAMYSDTQTIATRKGAQTSPLITLFTNRGSSGSGSITLSGLPVSTSFTDLLTCTSFTTTSGGSLAVTISGGLPRALYRSSALTGRDLCAPTPVTCPTANNTVTLVQGKSFQIECGLERIGTDISRVYVEGLVQCLGACAENTRCIYAALSGSACYLRSRVGSNPVANGVQGARLLPATTTTVTPLPTATTATTTSCSASATAVNIVFNHNAITVPEESIRIVGSIPIFGNFSGANAFPLSNEFYTPTNTIWRGNVTLAVGTYFEYKFLRNNATSGARTWETGPNRNYTTPRGCASRVILNSAWQVQ
jgi:hypothetical protein